MLNRSAERITAVAELMVPLCAKPPGFVKWKSYQYNEMRLMKLSLVIPAYNEAGRIEQSLEQVFDFLAGFSGSAEIIVVDDGSRDATPALVQAKAQGRPDLRLIRLPRNQGKGAAVRAGVLESQGDWILMTDADLSTPLSELPRFFAALADGFDLAVGSRQLPGARIGRRQPWLRQSAGLLFGFILRRIVPVGVVDTQCGFKLFRGEPGRNLFRRLSVKGFCFDLELLALARRAGLQITEIPVTWSNAEGSKVSLLWDLPGVIWEVLQIRWKLWRRTDRP